MTTDRIPFCHRDGIRIVSIACFPLARQRLSNSSFPDIAIDMIPANHGVHLIVIDPPHSVQMPAPLDTVQWKLQYNTCDELSNEVTNTRHCSFEYAYVAVLTQWRLIIDGDGVMCVSQFETIHMIQVLHPDCSVALRRQCIGGMAYLHLTKCEYFLQKLQFEPIFKDSQTYSPTKLLRYMVCTHTMSYTHHQWLTHVVTYM